MLGKIIIKKLNIKIVYPAGNYSFNNLDKLSSLFKNLYISKASVSTSKFQKIVRCVDLILNREVIHVTFHHRRTKIS